VTLSRRGQIVQAAKDLLWEEGFHSMSPRDIMKRSGAGQGSLYHHFSGKQQLAEEALWEVNRELCSLADRIFGQADRSPLERVRRFLDVVSREPIRGCRVGRLAAENAILDEVLRQPVARWFEHAEEQLAGALAEAQMGGEIDSALDPEALALTLMAVVQGGYLLARAHSDPGAMKTAVAGALSLLESGATGRTEPRAADRPAAGG
jgi:TetR/AcrR family transcriptional repressor of nem operon